MGASRGWTPLAHLETLTATRATSLMRSGASLHEGEPTPLRRAAGGEGEAAALVRRAAAPWSSASHSLFPAAARARAALLVRSIYEIHERYHLDSAGATNGIAALDFGHCVLGFAIARETQYPTGSRGVAVASRPHAHGRRRCFEFACLVLLHAVARAKARGRVRENPRRDVH